MTEEEVKVALDAIRDQREKARAAFVAQLINAEEQMQAAEDEIVRSILHREPKGNPTRPVESKEPAASW